MDIQAGRNFPAIMQKEKRTKTDTVYIYLKPARRGGGNATASPTFFFLKRDRRSNAFQTPKSQRKTDQLLPSHQNGYGSVFERGTMEEFTKDLDQLFKHSKVLFQSCCRAVVPNLFTPGTGKNFKKCSRTGNKRSVESRTYICNLSVNQSCRCVTYCKILA